ncbi:glycoside hydrolase family 31 protein [Aplosporella prunicola CBS 121167]|uniref:alpha-D-xyloside xylohydrolase n=1 Tax=Aplosporella prunicola CBS 121167 TaxID=1176127 RepID=A0A6A6B4G3_9PEZI|nr:glycoside hydrolase family 31 protein [Aplosporella prunicola CBS 121167]KAF2137641.1 glycoside hydrolase family 31 protein [Aplosporella prunicola CBS 121167]
MKFRDGMWLVAADKTVYYAEDVYTITERDDKALNLLCPTRQIRSRGDTLNLSTINVELEAQFDGVISIEATHFSGAQRRGPNFELYPDGRPELKCSISKSDKGTTLTAGALSASVGPDQHAFDIRFHATDGSKELTSLLNRSVGLAYSPALSNPKQVQDMRALQHYMFTQHELGVGESIHGLGERFGAFNKVGQSVELWNEDGGTSSDQAYKNVSFYLSSRGYGVFIDHPEHVSLEIGSERCCRVQTSVEGQRLKWYVIYGAGGPKEVLSKYAQLLGRAGRLPAWSFGLWLSTSFTTDYDEKTVTHFLEESARRECPVEVFHYDCFWLRAFHWCDFVFSPAHFPDPKGSIARLKAANLVNKVCVWINPYLGQASPIFAYAAEKGYLLKRPNGDIWQWDLWQTGMGIVDITNPAAAEWYTGCLNQLFDLGVDCIKTDFGERIPAADVQWHDASVDPARMHNFYAFAYNKLVYTTMQARFGPDGGAVLFARAATAGTQRFPLCWGGDCESTPAALAESIRGGLSLGLSGYSFWSCDIGGFEGSPPPWIYKRWVAFGLLCSHSRLHGSNSYRVPWLLDEGASGPESCSSVLRAFVRLKRRLMPYLYAQAERSRKKGWPVSLRAVALEFPEDPTAWTLDRQFFVGDSLLVAPVFTETGEVQFYLPRGRWTSYWDGSVVEGPGWRTETHGFESLPLYVREGSVLVLGQEEEKTRGEGFAYDWANAGGVVALYAAREGDEAVVVDTEGREVATLVADGKGGVSGLEKLGGEWSVRNVL